MQLNPHLSFPGRCRAAFARYAEIFNGRLLSEMTYGSTPAAAHWPADLHDWVIHARLDIGAGVLFGADSPPSHYKPPQGVQMTITVNSIAEAERLYAALSHNGTVIMPLAPTFWAQRFGVCTDEFAITWMVNCETTQES